MEFPCLSGKKETKILRELHADSPELKSMVGLPLPTLWVGSCSASETPAIREGCVPSIRAWHGGLLSHSKQRSDAIVLGLSRLRKGGRGRTLHFSHDLLFACAHTSRKYNQAFLVFEMQARDKPQR